MFFILGTSNKDQDGQNENNNGNGAPDGKEAPDGKGGPDDNGGEGSANVTIDKTSTWTVTGDSRVSKLVCSGTIVDNQGKNVTIKKSDGTVIKKGSNCYTITVDSYSAS